MEGKDGKKFQPSLPLHFFLLIQGTPFHLFMSKVTNFVLILQCFTFYADQSCHYKFCGTIVIERASKIENKNVIF